MDIQKKNTMEKFDSREVMNPSSDGAAAADDKKGEEFKEKISDVMTKYERTREIRIRTKRVAKYEPTKMVWSGCVLYYRRSTDMQDTTIESQKTDCIKKANELGLPIVKEYVDEISGKTEIHEREGLSELLENIQPGQVLIVYSISRIARQIEVFYGIMKILKDRGCRVVCCNEKLDSLDPYMEVIWAIHASFAQMEREAISSRTKRALETLKKNGVNVGRPKWGYIIDKNTRKLVPDPSTREIIQWMIKVRTENRYGLEEIADMLNELKVPSLSGKGKWDRRMVSVVLRRELGEEEARKHKLSKFINNRKNEKDLVEEDIEFIQSLNNPQKNTEKEEEEMDDSESETTPQEAAEPPSPPPSPIPETDNTQNHTLVPESKNNPLSAKPLPVLRALAMKRKAELGLSDEEIRDLSREDLILILN